MHVECAWGVQCGQAFSGPSTSLTRLFHELPTVPRPLQYSPLEVFRPYMVQLKINRVSVHLPHTHTHKNVCIIHSVMFIASFELMLFLYTTSVWINEGNFRTLTQDTGELHSK